MPVYKLLIIWLFLFFPGTNDFFPGLKRTGLSKLEPDKCPRFIKNPEIKIFDRRGQKVNALNSSEIGSLNEWTGQNENGDELPSGTYFYMAHIRYDTYDPSRGEQTTQGWLIFCGDPDLFRHPLHQDLQNPIYDKISWVGTFHMKVCQKFLKKGM